MCSQNPQFRLPEVITGNGDDYTLLGCPDGEVGGLPRDVKLPLYLVPVPMILLQAVDDEDRRTSPARLPQL